MKKVFLLNAVFAVAILNFISRVHLVSLVIRLTASLQNCHLRCACHCVMLLSSCCSVVIMLYCYCVTLLLFVSSYVLIVCTVPLTPGVNPIAVDKYIYLQSVPGGKDLTSGECSLGQTIPI